MFIESLSLFELLTSLAHHSEQIRLCDKAFPITHLSDSFHKYTITGMVEIEMVPIYHTSAQILRHAYFSIIADYLDVVEILHGVTGSSILNVCTESVIYISQFLLFLSLYN